MSKNERLRGCSSHFGTDNRRLSVSRGHTRRKESKLSLSATWLPRRRKFSRKARKFQNDVKYVQTHARKVFAQPFSKGWWGVGQRPTYGGVWGNAPHKQTNKSKFEKRKGGFSEIPFELYTLFKIFSRMAKKIYNYFLQKLNFVYCNTIIIMI